MKKIIKCLACMCQLAACGANITRTSGSGGTINSPLGPCPYPKNTDCSWTISADTGKIEEIFAFMITTATDYGKWFPSYFWYLIMTVLY